MAVLILNGRASSTKPDELVIVNKHSRFIPPVINGLMPTDVTINGLTYPPVLDGCVLNLPLWHSALSPASFKSLEANKHSCSVIGALWTPQGRSFDGIDDLITITDVASIQNIFDGGGTFETWVNLDTTGEGDAGRVASKNIWDAYTWNETGGYALLQFQQGFSVTGGSWRNDPRTLPIGRAVHIVVTYNNSAVGNDPIIYFNAVSQVIVEATTPVGTRTTDVGSNLILGNVTTANTLDGVIDEVRIYNRALTALEIMRNYQVSKWRYQ